MVEKILDLLYIYKDGCGPCDQMYPVLESFSKNRPDVNVYKFNFHEDDEFVNKIKVQLGVHGTPFFAAFIDNKIIKTEFGYRTAEELEKLFEFTPATSIDVKNKTIL